MHALTGRVGKWLVPACLAVGFASMVQAAPIFDDCSTTTNFGGLYNVTLTNNATAGTVTATRINGGTDAVVNWGQNAPVPIDDALLTITVDPSSHQDYYNVNLTFLDASKKQIGGDVSWGLGDVNVTKTLNITSLIPAGATQYYARFRVLPWNTAGANWTFTSIGATAVPEPASLGAIGLVGLALLRRRSH